MHPNTSWSKTWAACPYWGMVGMVINPWISIYTHGTFFFWGAQSFPSWRNTIKHCRLSRVDVRIIHECRIYDFMTAKEVFSFFFAKNKKCVYFSQEEFGLILSNPFAEHRKMPACTHGPGFAEQADEHGRNRSWDPAQARSMSWRCFIFHKKSDGDSSLYVPWSKVALYPHGWMVIHPWCLDSHYGMDSHNYWMDNYTLYTSEWYMWVWQEDSVQLPPKTGTFPGLLLPREEVSLDTAGIKGNYNFRRSFPVLVTDPQLML